MKRETALDYVLLTSAFHLCLSQNLDLSSPPRRPLHPIINSAPTSKQLPPTTNPPHNHIKLDVVSVPLYFSISTVPACSSTIMSLTRSLTGFWIIALIMTLPTINMGGNLFCTLPCLMWSSHPLTLPFLFQQRQKPTLSGRPMFLSHLHCPHLIISTTSAIVAMLGPDTSPASSQDLGSATIAAVGRPSTAWSPGSLIAVMVR